MPSHDKHIFVRPKKGVLILRSGGFRILGIVEILDLDFLFIIFEDKFSDLKNVPSGFFV